MKILKLKNKETGKVYKLKKRDSSKPKGKGNKYA